MKLKAGEYNFEGESAEIVDFFKASGVDASKFFKQESSYNWIHYTVAIAFITLMYIILPIALSGNKYMNFVYYSQLLLVGILAFSFHGIRKDISITASVAILMIAITGLEWGYLKYTDIQKLIESKVMNSKKSE